MRGSFWDSFGRYHTFEIEKESEGYGWDGRMPGGSGAAIAMFIITLVCQLFGYGRLIGRTPDGFANESFLMCTVMSALLVIPFAAARILYDTFLFSGLSILTILLSIVLPFAYSLFPDLTVLKVLYFAECIITGLIPGGIYFILSKLPNLTETGGIIIAAILTVFSISEGIMLGGFLKNPHSFRRRFR